MCVPRLTLAKNMTITITISNQTGEEVSRILNDLQFKVRGWPGANSFKLGLRDLHGNKVGECVAAPTAKPERSKEIRDACERFDSLCEECQDDSEREDEDYE